MKVVGQIEKSFEKDTGSFKYWAIEVAGREYRCGKFAPRGINVGDWVEFEATSKQNGNYTNYTADYKTLRKSDPGAVGSGPAQESIDSKPAARSYTPTNNDERQETISRQAAFNTAIAMGKFLHETGAFALPAKVKKDLTFEFYKDLIDELAVEFYAKSTGKTWKIDKPKAAEADDFSDDVPEGDAW